MSAALTLTSHGSSPPMWGAFSRTPRKLRTQLITTWRLFMLAALSSRASLPPMWEALNRTIRKLVLSRKLGSLNLPSKLCSEAFLKSSTRTRRDLLTLQI